MLTASPQQRIFLAVEPVDMRGGFDRLAGRVRNAGLDLYAGHLFVFVSRRCTHLKVLTWDGTGLVVLYKRLGKGRFVVPGRGTAVGTTTLDPTDFAALLRGPGTVGVGRSLSADSGAAQVDEDEKL